MTLRDLFTDKTLWAKYGDMDVYNDCIDDMAAAWCGTIMTFEGAEHYDSGYKYSNYGKILDTPIEISAGTYGFDIEVKVDDYPDYSKRWNYISQIFSDAAGYCTEEEYDRWFIDDYDNEEPTQPVFDDHKALCLLIDHTPIDRIKEAIAEDERLLPFLESIGYNTQNLK